MQRRRSTHGLVREADLIQTAQDVLAQPGISPEIARATGDLIESLLSPGQREAYRPTMSATVSSNKSDEGIPETEARADAQSVQPESQGGSTVD